MPTLPTTPLTPQAIAASIGASPTTPTDPNVMGSLVGGTTGLTPTALNALLGYQSDISQANTDVTAANAQGRTDTLAATQAGYQADTFGLEGQQEASQANVFNMEGQQAQADADVYGLKATADANESAGYGLQAAGYGKEIDAYNTAAGISAENAALAVMSGNVQKAQQQREIFKTLGSQRAQVANAGFSGDSGSAMALYRDSVGQGNLQLAMTDLQTNINQGSYLEAAAASRAMADAVGVAKTGAETAQKNALVQQQEDLVAQQKAGLGVAENTEAANQQNLAVQKSALAQQGALAAENTYNVAASTDATAAATAAQTASTAQVNMTNLVNTIGTTGAGTTTGTPTTGVDSILAGGTGAGWAPGNGMTPGMMPSGGFGQISRFGGLMR